MTASTSVPSTTEAVSRALESFAELPDWLAALMRPGRLEGSLRRHVAEVADGRLEIVSCRPDQLRAKDDQWHARCRVTIAKPTPAPDSAPSGSSTDPADPADPAGPADLREVVLVGLLYPPDRAAPDPLPSSRLPFGTEGYEVWLPDLRVHLATEEADPGLPSLGDLTDPEASARLIEDMLRGGGHPEARVRSATPDIARYKPGSRCTIVYDMTYESDTPGLPDPVIAKTHQGDKGAFAHQAMTALWATPLAEGRSVLIAEPLGYLPDERILLQGPVPEDRTLKELCVEAFETGDPDLLEALRGHLSETARALAALHTSGAAYPRTVTVDDWMAETREVVERLGHTVPELPTWAAPLIATLEHLDASTPADPLVSSHHDFRPAQVLLSEAGLAFIDFDGAAMAEAGLDIGRFRGKLRDIGVTALAAQPEGYREDLLRDRLELLDVMCDDFLADYRRHADVSPGRVELWEMIDLFMALLHTWTKVRLLRVHPRLAIVLHRLQALGAPTP
ncbi:MAG: hypothetical protein WCA30_01390 [Dermatophilaceae bacterium]